MFYRVNGIPKNNRKTKRTFVFLSTETKVIVEVEIINTINATSGLKYLFLNY